MNSPGSEFGAAIFGRRGTSRPGEQRGDAGGWLSAFWAALIGRPQIASDAATGTGDIPPAAEPSQAHRLDVVYAPQDVAARVEVKHAKHVWGLSHYTSSLFNSAQVPPAHFKVSPRVHKDIEEAWRRLRSTIDDDDPVDATLIRFLEQTDGVLKVDDRAREHLLHAIARNTPDSPIASDILAGLSLNEDERDFVRIILYRMVNLEDSRTAPSAMLSLGDLEKARGDLTRARRWYQLSFSSHSGNASSHARLRLRLLPVPESLPLPPRQRDHMSSDGSDAGSPVSPEDTQR